MPNLFKRLKSLSNSLLALGMGLSVFSYAILEKTETVEAAGSYPYACSTLYSVDQANSDGTLSNIYCTNELADAQHHMNSSTNYVVRARDNLSPSKIVMMHGGLVYTYPMRSGKTTLDLSHWSNGNSATTYATKHREMLYGWTNWATGQDGQIAVSVNGFNGYVELKEVDLIPWAWVDNGKTVTLGGHDTTAANEQPFATKIKQSHYNVYESNGQKLLSFTWSSGWSANGDPATYTHVLGPVPENVANGTYYSYDGYTFYTDRACKNHSFTYYNYYQYLPFRSKTNLTADELNRFIDQGVNGRTSVLKGTGQYFIDAQNKYGINAAIVLAIAILESGYGTSQYAIQRNNLFGISAYDSNPDSATHFQSVQECINQMMGYYLKDYSDIKDTRFFGAHLGNKGSGANVKYAADTYWGLKIASLYYQMDAYSHGADLVDYNTVSRGLITTYNAAVDLNPGSHQLFSTANKSGYQEAYIIPILSTEGEWTKWQCNNKVENGNIVSNGFITYDWNASQVYTRSSDIMIINDASNTDRVPEGSVPTGDFNFVPTLSIQDHILTISGTAYRPGITVNDTNTLTHQITMIDAYYSGTVIESETTVEKDEVGHFKATVDLSTLENGEYKFTVSTNYGYYDQYNDTDHLIGSLAELPSDIEVDDHTIHFENRDDGITYMLISDNSEELPDGNVPVVPEEPEQPDTPDENELPHILMSTLNGADMDGTILSIHGLAYLTNINATEDMADDISISIRLIDRNDPDGQGYPLDASIGMYDQGFPNGDFRYDYIAYHASIDTSTIPNSVYTVEITVTNSGITNSSILYSNNKDALINEYIGSTETGGTMFELTENYDYGYRVEINKEASMVDLTDFVINKPSRQTSTITVNDYAFDMDQQTLTFSGNAYIRILDIDDSTIPSGQIYLVSSEDGQFYEGNVQWSAGDTALPISGTNGFTVTNSAYQASFDLTDVPPGEYKIMIYETIDIDGTVYSDLFEVRSATVRQGITQANETRSFTFEQTSIRNRIKLTINDLVETLTKDEADKDEEDERPVSTEGVEQVDKESDGTEISPSEETNETNNGMAEISKNPSDSSEATTSN